MKLQGYKCNQCGHLFEEVDSKQDVVCIECGSHHVEKNDAVSELLELVREIGRTGG